MSSYIKIKKYSVSKLLRFIIINRYWSSWNAFSATLSCFYELLDLIGVFPMIVFMIEISLYLFILSLTGTRTSLYLVSENEVGSVPLYLSDIVHIRLK